MGKRFSNCMLSSLYKFHQNLLWLVNPRVASFKNLTPNPNLLTQKILEKEVSMSRKEWDPVTRKKLTLTYAKHYQRVPSKREKSPCRKKNRQPYLPGPQVEICEIWAILDCPCSLDLLSHSGGVAKWIGGSTPLRTGLSSGPLKSSRNPQASFKGLSSIIIC